MGGDAIRLSMPWRSCGDGGTMSRVDDPGLVADFRAGGPAAVRAVYERYSGAVFTVAMSVLGDRDLAADAVQVTFLNAWRSRRSLDVDRPLAPWLYAIARRAAIDLYGRRVHAPEPVEPQGEGPVSPSPSFEGIWEAWEIRAALDALPLEERQVVYAQHYQGLTHSQIAAHLGLPLGTVESRSHRAHRRLASMLGHLVEISS
jgi:RNA polymerase sigma-70 factor (ECF subfamily)